MTRRYITRLFTVVTSAAAVAVLVSVVLQCLTVMPVSAHIDPQSLVGVWDGTYEIRRQTGQHTPRAR